MLPMFLGFLGSPWSPCVQNVRYFLGLPSRPWLLINVSQVKIVLTHLPFQAFLYFVCLYFRCLFVHFSYFSYFPRASGKWKCLVYELSVVCIVRLANLLCKRHHWQNSHLTVHNPILHQYAFPINKYERWNFQHLPWWVHRQVGHTFTLSMSILCS